MVLDQPSIETNLFRYTMVVDKLMFKDDMLRNNKCFFNHI